jgi:predicted nucleic acid-binding protein
MRAADTNILLRLLLRDDPRQTAAAETFVRDGVWISHLVLAEAAWRLESVYGFEPARIAEAVEKLLDNPVVAIQDIDVVLAALAHFKAKSGIELADCLILEIARKAGHSPLGSFDRKFAKLPGVEQIGR